LGAWDVDSFGNDTAIDWTFGLEEVSDLSLVGAALGAVMDTGTDYLDADLACKAIAACEVVARLRGNWGKRDAYTESVDQWVSANQLPVSPALMEKVGIVIDRILQESSELFELWEESGDFENWKAAMTNLRDRATA